MIASIFADLRAAVATSRDTVLTAPEAEGLLACLDALGDHWGRLEAEALTGGPGPTDLPLPAQLQLANMAAGRGQAFRLAIATLSTTTARQP
jgi:hypothetical protein